MITLFHTHGIDRFDFSSLEVQDLAKINSIAEQRHLLLCPTVYLHRDGLARFVTLMEHFRQEREDGKLLNILGFSAEGPMIGDGGGIPAGTNWRPTKDEWRSITRLGKLGLRYMVLGPDAIDLDDEIDSSLSFAEFLTKCYDSGLRIAMGHFSSGDPERSAYRIRAVLEFLHNNYESSPYLVLTDHLFNDMPRSFVNAWRTREERRRRNRELAIFLRKKWEPDTLHETLGPVPAILLNAARSGLLTPSLNFDGYHVDIDICRLTVNYLGFDRLIPITDSTEIDQIAGEQLYRIEDIPLRFRRDRRVAVGMTNHEQQIANMRSIGLSKAEVDHMFGVVARRALNYTPRPLSRVRD